MAVLADNNAIHLVRAIAKINVADEAIGNTVVT